MSFEDAEAMLLEQIEQRIQSFDSRRNFYRHSAFRYAFANMMFAAMTTFFIAVSEMFEPKVLAVLALLTSAFTTVLAAWDGFVGHRQRWAQTNETLMQLYALRFDVVFERKLSGTVLNEEHLRAFQGRYSDILRNANEGWFRLRQEHQDA